MAAAAGTSKERAASSASTDTDTDTSSNSSCEDGFENTDFTKENERFFNQVHMSVMEVRNLAKKYKKPLTDVLLKRFKSYIMCNLVNCFTFVMNDTSLENMKALLDQFPGRKEYPDYTPEDLEDIKQAYYAALEERKRDEMLIQSRRHADGTPYGSSSEEELYQSESTTEEFLDFSSDDDSFKDSHAELPADELDQLQLDDVNKSTDD